VQRRVAAHNSTSEDARIHTHTQGKNAKHVRDSEKETQVQDDRKAAEDDDIWRKDKTGERRRRPKMMIYVGKTRPEREGARRKKQKKRERRKLRFFPESIQFELAFRVDTLNDQEALPVQVFQTNGQPV